MNPTYYVLMLYTLDIILTNIYIYSLERKGLDGLKFELNFIPRFAMRKVNKKLRIPILLIIFIPLISAVLYYQPQLTDIMIGAFLLANYIHVLNFIKYFKVRNNERYWLLFRNQIKEMEKIKSEN